LVEDQELLRRYQLLYPRKHRDRSKKWIPIPRLWKAWKR
jgi:hypothetical protein